MNRFALGAAVLFCELLFPSLQPRVLLGKRPFPKQRDTRGPVVLLLLFRGDLALIKLKAIAVALVGRI